MEMSDDEGQKAAVDGELFDVDTEHATDAQCVTEFAHDIYKYLHQSQRKYVTAADYLQMQTDITSNMTGILLDWLVEVAEEYHLTNETLHLSKIYIERFLAMHKVARQRLQLVGICGMLIASKFEEIFPPGVEDFVYISDNTFTRQQVIEMESTMLNTLAFDLTNPTSIGFLTRYTRVAGSDPLVVLLSTYLCELTLMEYSMTPHLPSHIALAALVLANQAQRVAPALPALLRGTYFVESDRDAVERCLSAMHKLWLGAARNKLQAVRLKYERTRHQKVACINPPASLPTV